MNTRWWIVIIGVLLMVIFILAWILFATPAPGRTPSATQPENWSVTPTPSKPSTQTPSTQPLHTKVSVTSPKSGARVGHTFTVKGKAPGNWYFEAVFPIKIITPDGERIGSAQAQAQGDWMTENLVPFSATVTVTLSYSGPARLALLRANPAGLPENDDSLEIPIVIQ